MAVLPRSLQAQSLRAHQSEKALSLHEHKKRELLLYLVGSGAILL